MTAKELYRKMSFMSCDKEEDIRVIEAFARSIRDSALEEAAVHLSCKGVKCDLETRFCSGCYSGQAILALKDKTS